MSEQAKQAQTSIIADWSPNNIEHYVQKAIDDATADLRTKLAAAEAELERFKHDCDLLKQECLALSAIEAGAQRQVTEMKSELSALREDKERLDWLSLYSNYVNLDKVYWSITDKLISTSLRQAIDAARKPPIE